MNFNIEEAVRALRGDKLSQSLGDFFRMFWGINSNVPLSLNWHIDYLCERLSDLLHNYLDDKEKHLAWIKRKDEYEIAHGGATYDEPPVERSTKHLLINLPPRSSKSLLGSITFPVWAWTKNPSLQFTCISYAEHLALDLAQKSMNIIRNREFQDIFGSTVSLGKNTAVGHYSLKRSDKSESDVGFRRSVGVGGTVTGLGGDIIIVDDPIKPGEADESISDKNLKSVQEFWDGTLSTRLNTPSIGVYIVIMQRLHEKDLSGHILDSPYSDSLFEHICFPAEIKSTYSIVRPQALRSKYRAGLLWPDRFSETQLKVLSAKMKAKYFGQYLQVPVNPEGALIMRDWLRFTDFIPESCGRNLIFLDPAYTEDKHNNPTGIIVCTVDYHKKTEGEGISPYGTIYVLSAQEVRYEFHRLITHILSLISEFTKGGEPPVVYVEPKASGKSIYQGLRKAIPTVPVFQIKGEIVDKRDKRGRLSACSIYIENGNLVLLKDNSNDNNKNWNKLLENQLCTFPYSKNDDLVDCISYAFWMTHKNRGLQIGGLKVNYRDRKSMEERKILSEEEAILRNGELISTRGNSMKGGYTFSDTTIKNAISRALGEEMM